MRNDRILVADSDTTVAACITEVLITEGYTVCCYPGEELTAEAIERSRPDLVIMELWRPNPDITPLLDQLERAGASGPAAMIVNSTDRRVLRDLAAPLARHGYKTLLKPFDLDQLLDSVAGALDDRRARLLATEDRPDA